MNILNITILIRILYTTTITILISTNMMIPYVETLRSVKLNGAGASFPSLVYNSWTTMYRSSRSRFVDLRMTYDSVGSGSGKLRIKELEEPFVEYAGSDSVLNDREMKEYPDLQMLPSMAGSVVFIYNLPNTKFTLNLTREIIVGIFNGTLNFWNDSKILEVNPLNKLPYERILVIVRSDKSGTTEIITKSLSSFSSQWKEKYGTFSSVEKWKQDQVYLKGQSSNGMTGLISSIPYTLGYVSISDAIKSEISYAAIRNKEGNFVNATFLNVQSVMDAMSTSLDENLMQDLEDGDGKESYPVAAYTYIIIRKSTLENCNSAIELYRYIEWFTTNEIAQEECMLFHMTPLSKEVAIRIQKVVLDNLKCSKTKSVSELVADQKHKEYLTTLTWRTPAIIGGILGGLVLLLICCYLIFQQIRLTKALSKQDWNIDQSEIVIKHNLSRSSNYYNSAASTNTASSSEASVNINSKTIKAESKSNSLNSKGSNVDCLEIGSKSKQVASYNNQLVLLRASSLIDLKNVKKQLSMNLMDIKLNIQHANVQNFFGLSEIEDKVWLVSEYCSKGFLCDILSNDKYNLDENFKYSISIDIANGMAYLHSMNIVHGQLSSATCSIDSKWTVKIADWEWNSMNGKCKKTIATNKVQPMDIDLSAEVIARRKLWSAPEHILDASVILNKNSDVYSFAIVISEVFSRCEPYSNIDSQSINKILQMILSTNLRPELSPECNLKLINLLELCWHVDPIQRPNFNKIKKQLMDASPTKKSVLDCMIESMDMYMKELEERVNERTDELANAVERQRSLLHEILPPAVADKLMKGENVDPEYFDLVTIYFSDIVGFTKISSESTPIQIINLLNSLYSAFDNIISLFDAYKVETIGDAYMVISGLPKVNGTKHVSEIARLSIKLLGAAIAMPLPHKPDQHLNLRVGVHTGPCMAGVVGLKMPRYCLFGDTVNVASRMESTSIAGKIQVSEDSAILLLHENLNDLKLIPRGETEIKGKGVMKTYWLSEANAIE